MPAEFYEYRVRVEQMTRGWAVDIPREDDGIGITLTGPSLERLLRMAAGWVADAVLDPEP